MQLNKVSLDDKYELEEGRVFLTGLQALVRLPMMQRQKDLASGLNTAGFISGYRGSPLGGYDAALWQAKRYLEQAHVKFQPGVNEDLAMTSVWGTQQIGIWPGAKYDGVFGIWYGKGPGVDRSCDALKHVNFNGTSPHGGAIAIAGDDHGCKSSTLPHQSEYAFMSSFVPVINPAGVQEYIDYGLYGFAMSRFSGAWIGFKAVGETVESSASVSIDPERVKIVLPEFEFPASGVHIRYPDDWMEQEDRVLNYKLPAAQAFARANGLDRIIYEPKKPRLGIITTGKSYLDVRQAFDELGITPNLADELGIRLYKVALTWPLEPVGALEFAKDLEEIIVVEEKRPLIEDQLTKLLYNRENTPKRIVGKKDEQGRSLLPEAGELSPGMVARVLSDRLKRYVDRPEFEQSISRLDQIDASLKGAPPTIARTPYFCSGCPHNSSTKIPSGSRAMAGIGCHGMALFIPARETKTITHMGAEGANWIGQAPFVKTKHVFQNLGDGTYFHSGLMAIRAAVDANVNITYKILYNDAVAMTGGQPVINHGQLTPADISRQVAAEGVNKVVLVTDEPDKYPIGTNWSPGLKKFHRDDLDSVQRDLREIEGVTVLIYDQTCAAEKRRRRKRGLFPDPPKRAFINQAVCEGCGDCSAASNCVSVLPDDTELGRKRKIDQSSCNKDFSCIKGFCPSFVTVNGGQVRKAKQTSATANNDLFNGIPAPSLAPAGEPYGIVVTGIGGTGVITIGALLGMAAHLEGKGCSVLDITGLAQKNGAVASHIRIADDPDELHSTKIAAGAGQLILGCDMVVATSPDTISVVNQGTTRAVINEHVVPTAAFVQDQTLDFGAARMVKKLKDTMGEGATSFVNATKLATALLGDSIATNLFMVGYAAQKGLLPVSVESIEAAVRLNNVAVAANLQAFAWGRLAAHDLGQVEAIAAPLMSDAPENIAPLNLAETISDRVARLNTYQNAAYGERYRQLVDKVAAAEQAKTAGYDGLAMAAARNLFKVMAYKDEYEVARLYADPKFMNDLQRQFEGDVKLTFHLAPPLLAKRDSVSGELKKQEFGPWMMPAFHLLAKMKGLRGGVLDIFGRSEERKAERALITTYETVLGDVIDGLTSENHAIAVEIAQIPDDIKGYGHVKERNLKGAREKLDRLLELFQSPEQATANAAE